MDSMVKTDVVALVKQVVNFSEVTGWKVHHRILIYGFSCEKVYNPYPCILDFTIEFNIRVDNLFKDGFDFVGGILSG